MGTTNLSSSISSPHLLWVWVIEALAEFEQVDTALLDDLLSNVPELLNQSWGRKARERLALRHMEDLLRGLSPNADATNVASTSKSHSMFDISAFVQAENVLFCVRNQNYVYMDFVFTLTRGIFVEVNVTGRDGECDASNRCYYVTRFLQPCLVKLSTSPPSVSPSPSNVRSANYCRERSKSCI